MQHCVTRQELEQIVKRRIAAFHRRCFMYGLTALRSPRYTRQVPQQSNPKQRTLLIMSGSGEKVVWNSITFL